MLEIVVCSLIILIDNPQSFTNGDNLGQGNLNLVSEKSGKSQGILLSIICGNPVSVTCVYYGYVLLLGPYFHFCSAKFCSGKFIH